VHFEGYGEPIPNLTVTKVLFWNAGRDTIKKSDVVKGQQVALVAQGNTKILEADIIEQNHPTNSIRVTVTRERDRANVDFDYLDHGHGAVIQVFHTGLKQADLQISGVIQGTKGIKEAKDKAPVWFRLLLALALGLFCGALYYMAGRPPLHPFAELLLGVAVGTTFSAITRYVYRLCGGGIPREFKSIQ
jgi:hypothetical protein